ncbi:DUF6544 family protein [Methanogenium organophilum]|uniref:Uncharacterized protein n=1 Tax=Methanogenium organophilum TaxID=2199 RepID=A0A9X9S4A3_METOG|nr:DUF6544 family protein [Methanogenium organophilum]WAI01724.1 hypothetical protein OU421_02300 [Methanogenium organophilum]
MIVLLIFGIIVIGSVVCILVSGSSFQRSVEDEISGLSRGAEQSVPKPIPAEKIESLPEPVRRYLGYAIPEGREPVRFVRMKETGEFRTEPGGKWMPLEAEQYFSAGVPGFIWHAKIRANSLFWIDVRDKYVGNQGNMLVKLLSTVPVADAMGPEIDVSSLHRYIGEMPWFPTTFLNEEHITWEPVDSSRARAIIADGENTATVEFSFDEAGRITLVTTDERYRTVGDRFFQDTWTGYYDDYQEIGGFRVPMQIAAEWNLPDGDFSYVRLRVTEIEYDVFSGY